MNKTIATLILGAAVLIATCSKDDIEIPVDPFAELNLPEQYFNYANIQLPIHYSSGIQNHPNLITPLVNSDGKVGQFNFTQEEKDALVTFLNTLTDNQMLLDEKYSDPFE